jgi:hypothetical protein
MFGAEMFEPAAGAAAIVARLTDDLQPDLADAKMALCADVAWRTDWADGMIAHLLADGVTADRLSWALRWDDFWTNCAAVDDELTRIASEKADVWHEIVESATRDPSLQRRLDELGDAHTARVRVLLADFEPMLDLREIDRIRKLGQRLTSARNLGDLFTRYQKLDERLQKVERALDDAAIGWDRAVQAEVDRRRGK